jgi:hypothetical protein
VPRVLIKEATANDHSRNTRANHRPGRSLCR